MKLARIRIHPLKSFDGLDRPSARVLPSGALEHDRRFAIVDEAGRILNAKREPRIQAIRCHFAADLSAVAFQRDGSVKLDRAAAPTFGPWRFAEDRSAIETWLSEALGQRVRLIENAETGFPDDIEATGPTLVAEATWSRIAEWFRDAGIDAESVRHRFRANLELSDLEPFGEDRFFGPAGSLVPFSIGAVRFVGVNPCQRCPVPGRDPWSGVADPGFQARFASHRQAELPAWSAADRFNHFYRLTVNTRLEPGADGGEIRVGDPVTVGEPVAAS